MRWTWGLVVLVGLIGGADGDSLLSCLRKALGGLNGNQLLDIFTGSSKTGISDCFRTARTLSDASDPANGLSSSGPFRGVQRIYQGSDARVWPHHAGLCIDDEVRCGGSLISDEWVLTAAHCLEGIRSGRVKVVLGARVLRVSVSASESRHQDSCNNPRGREQIAKVARIVRHPSYGSPLVSSNDIALLHLESPVHTDGDYVAPIRLQLAVEPILPGEECWVMGWGVTEGFAESSVLQEAELRIRPHPDCLAVYGVERIDHTMFCAGEVERVGANTCKGDSGGSLVCRRSNEWILAGITSFGDPCGTQASPGVYSNMDRLLGFVSETLYPGRPITRLKVVSGRKGLPLACPKGYVRVPQNLQAIAGGSKRVFVCYYRSAREQPITELRLSFNYTGKVAACPSGFRGLGMGEGRKGAGLTLCYRQSRGEPAVTDIISIMRYWEYEKEANPSGYHLLQPPVAFDYRKIIFLAYKTGQFSTSPVRN